MDNATIFSGYEVNQLGVKYGATVATVFDTVGSFEEELNTKVVTKKSRGVPFKTAVRGDGTGTIKLKAHMPVMMYNTAFGFNLTDYAAGVSAYGTGSRHPSFVLTARVEDEDGNIKYKAYPNCIIKSGPGRKVENGADEVAEIELEISIMPDEDGNGLYEAFEADVTTTIKDGWMSNFSATLIEPVI